MAERYHLTYRGSSMRARQLVGALRNEGLEVDWTPPMERRDASAIGEAAAVELVVFAAGWTSRQVADAIKRVVARWREAKRGEIEWREEDGYR